MGNPLIGHTQEVTSIAFSPDGQLLASGARDQTIRLWKLPEGSAVDAPLIGHTDAVTTLAFSPDGKSLLSGSADHHIIIWNMATQKPSSAPLTGHKLGVTAIAVNPVAPLFASASDDGTVILWDSKTNQRVGIPLSIKMQYGILTSIAFSPDGKTIAVGSSDSRVQLLDVDFNAWKKRACDIANRDLTAAEWVEYLPLNLSPTQICPPP